jgi:hypothetical protein
MFREQVNRLSLWFEQWNECEQTVALYSLLKRLSPHQARFCSLVLEQCLQDCADLQQQEQRANNPGQSVAYAIIQINSTSNVPFIQCFDF